MADVIISNSGSLVINGGSSSMPKGGYTVTTDGSLVYVKAIGSSTGWKLDPAGTTLDGASFGTPQDLVTALSDFSRGGTGPGSGVQTVTGDLVSGTATNPVVNMPVLDEGEFLIGGESGNEQRTLKGSDFTTLPVGDAAFSLGFHPTSGWSWTSRHSGPVNNSLVQRTNNGQGKFAPAINGDEAIVKSQFDSALENKVDKEVGKELSQENFTTAEKDKLAGLEDVHYKGWFTSLASLEAAHPAPEEGSHALVDDPSGSSVYIWKTDVEPPLWDARVGEGTEMSVAQVKTYYESNPDTNAFTDALKNKLEAFTANFTSALKTAYDNAVSWISANGANVLNHLSNTNNPHNVTAAQLGIVGLENLGKAWIPDYANMETTNRITSSGGSWTSDRRGFVYVLSRGYNSSIYNTVVVTINGKEVGKVWVEATSGSGSARSGSFSNIYPVKPGDVVTVTGNLETKCLFIPGILV